MGNGLLMILKLDENNIIRYPYSYNKFNLF